MVRNRLSLATVVVCLTIAGVSAQNEDNAIRYSLTKPTGTARSMGLGGAMGALGGDYSAIGINPAGIAVYRTSEFSFTPSLQFNNTESDYYDYSAQENKFSLPINHISYVGTIQPMRVADKGLVSTHFAVGYNRTNNFNRKSFIQGSNIQSSLLDQVVSYTRGTILEGNSTNNFYTFYVPYLINPLPNAGTKTIYKHNNYNIDYSNTRKSDQYTNGWEYIDWENPEYQIDNDTTRIYSVFFGIPDSIDVNGQIEPYGLRQKKIINEIGYQGEFSIAFGANFSHKFLLGTSLNIATIFNKKDFEHFEENPLGIYNDNYILDHEKNSTVLKNFSYTDYEKNTGIGINFKIGAIYHPTNFLRLGASLHTPTFFSMNTKYELNVSPQFFDITEQEVQPTNGEVSYNFRTPLKAIGSVAWLFGDKGLVSIDYEFTDYSSMKYSSKDNNMSNIDGFNQMNDVIKSTFKNTNNLRVGAEYRINPILLVRGGYAYFDNPYKSIYENSGDKHYNITGGLGFRQQNMFIDLAYLYRYQSYIHSLYYSPEIDNEFQKTAQLTSVDHQIAVTIGWKF